MVISLDDLIIADFSGSLSLTGLILTATVGTKTSSILLTFEGAYKVKTITQRVEGLITYLNITSAAS